jgi:rhodanese-related sulfurtransferase
MAVEHDADVEPATAQSLEPQRVAEMLEADEVELIDLREDHEWEAGRLAGARHVPIEQVTTQADTIDRERPVVFYCRSGNRSAMVADAFRLDGYDAYNMAGGVSAWAEAGLALEPEGGSVAER